MPAFELAQTCGSARFPGLAYGPAAVVPDGQGHTYVAGTFTGTARFGSAVLTATPRPGRTSTDSTDVFVAKLDAQGNYLWAVRAGGELEDFATALALDNTGHVFVAGHFKSYSLGFGPGVPALFNSSGGYEVFVARLDAATGAWQWARRAGGRGNDLTQGLAVDPAGSVYVAGEVQTGYHSNSFQTVVADFGPFVLASPGATWVDPRLFVAKLDGQGAWQWAQQPGGLASSGGGALALDAAGRLYVGAKLQATPDGGTAVFGSTGINCVSTPQPVRWHNSFGWGEVVVARLSAQGAWQWAVQGDPANRWNAAVVSGLALDQAGHVFVTGNYSGPSAQLGPFLLPNHSTPEPNPGNPGAPPTYPSDAFVARLDTAGTWQWAVRVGGAYNDIIERVVADTRGRVYVAGGDAVTLWGRRNGTSQPAGGFVNPLTGAASSQVSLAQLDGATGQWQWAYRGIFHDVALDAAGRLYAAGKFGSSTQDFGPFTLAAPGPNLYTGFLARLGTGPLTAARAAGPVAALTVWPNPARPGEAWLGGAPAGAWVQVYDVLGRAVARQRVPAGGGPLRLALPPGLPPGVYVVRAAGQARRLVIE
jgi:hypothetical protein